MQLFVQPDYNGYTGMGKISLSNYELQCSEQLEIYKNQVLVVPQSDYYSHKRNSSLYTIFVALAKRSHRKNVSVARWPYH